jgi:hypothetical protein
MLQSFLCGTALVLLGIVPLAQIAPLAPAAGENPNDRTYNTNDQIRAKLAQPINLDKGFDKNTPLRDALEYLGALRDLTIQINAKAFEGDLHIKEIDQQPISLPVQNAVPTGDVLHALVTQVNGTFVIRSGVIEVTTPVRRRPAAWKEKGFDRRKVPTVDALFFEIPLEQALRRLADNSGIKVVLDKELKDDRAKALVSISFKGIPLDTAAQRLAELARLEVVAREDALYLTTAARAREVQKRAEKRHGKTD